MVHTTTFCVRWSHWYFYLLVSFRKWGWRFVFVFCLTDMTAHLEHSQWPLVKADSITSQFIIYRYNNTTGTFTVPSGGDGFFYFSVYCLQIWQHNWYIHIALWWRWILFFLCLLFTDITAQPEHSQCPLVETESITSLFIVYRYDSTTGTFTVPSGGDGYYFLSTYLLGVYSEYSNFDLQINGNILCTVRLEQHDTSGDWLQSGCSAATYAAQGITGLVYKIKWKTGFMILF